MFESFKFDQASEGAKKDRQYRSELAKELLDEKDHSERKKMLLGKQGEKEYWASDNIAKLRHNVYVETRGQFTPEKLDVLTSLIYGDLDREQKDNVVRTTFDELIFEMAQDEKGGWREKIETYLRANLEKRKSMVENIDRYILEQHKLDRKLRNHQLGALVKIKDFLEDGLVRGYVAHPTGAGKTMLFSSLIKSTNARTLIVVPTRLLVKQTLKELRKNMPEKRLTYVSTTSEEDMNKDDEVQIDAEKGSSGDIVVITNQSFKFDTDQIYDQNFDLVVVDEAHNSYTDIYQSSLRNFPDAIKVAFTATPDYYYTEDAPDYERVDVDGTELYLNPEKTAAKYYPHEIDRISLREGIESKMLVELCAAVVRIDINLDEAKKVKTKKGLDFNENDLDRLFEKHWPTLKAKVVESYFKGIKNGVDGLDVLRFDQRQVYAVCSSVKKAEDLAQEFIRRGVKAACVTNETDDDERDEIFKKYKNKEIKVITSVSVLKEGWDMPEAEVCLMLRPTLSRIFYEQVLGRVLRLDENNPEKVGLVVDFLGKYKKMTPMTAPGMFGVEEFYNGQFIVPKRKRVEKKEDIQDEERFESPYNVSTVLEKIERVEKMNVITNELVQQGNAFYASRKFLEDKFFIRPESLQAFLEKNIVGTTKFGKATLFSIEDVVQSYLRRGEISIQNLGYSSLQEISGFLRLQKKYLSFIAEKNGIVRFKETDAFGNGYIAYESGPLWRAVEKDLKEKMKTILDLDQGRLEDLVSAEEVKRGGNIKIERDEKLILSDKELYNLNLTKPEDILRLLKHVANQKGMTGAKRKLQAILFVKQIPDGIAEDMKGALEKIKSRQDFIKKDYEIIRQCNVLLETIEKKKGDTAFSR